MASFLRRNGLSLALLSMFLASQIGLSLVGFAHYNDEQKNHDQPTVTLVEYLTSGSYLEVTMENWESEFLQMFAYVLLTVFLYQQGSAESKDPDQSEPVDRDPRLSMHKPDAPWPVRRGGLILKVYENSLSLALFALFLIAFVLHGVGGTLEYNLDQLAHGDETVTTLQYFGSSQFWYESLQNWQSEFLSIAVMVLLSIHLRQRGSPESKPVDSPHSETGA